MSKQEKLSTTRKPTDKQKAFADAYLQTRDRTEAAMIGFNPKNRTNASKMAWSALQSPAVQNYIAQVLDDAGLDDTTFALHLRKIIQAGTTRRALKKASPADSLRGIEMGLKLKDRFPAEKRRIEKAEIKIDFTNKSPKQLQSMLNKKMKEIQQWQEENSSKVVVEENRVEANKDIG